jgi:hypothetical protein
MAVSSVQSQTTYGSGAYPANSGVFIPEVWSKRLNQKFYKSTCLSDICNKNWEGK